MQNTLRILMAQINPTVGALAFNRDKIIEIIKNKQDDHDVILFPELALTGYPPEDLLFRNEFHLSVIEHLIQIQEVTKDCYVVVGHPSIDQKNCYNSVSILHQGQIITTYHKQKLPNYEIFDEARYFTAGERKPCILKINNYQVGICICEDAWQRGPIEDLIEHGVSIILIPNASPFDEHKYQKREALLKSYAQQGVAIAYVNQIGGQDELLFDGHSFALDQQGTVCARASAFKEELCTIKLQDKQLSGSIAPLPTKEALLYEALICGTRDYVNKNQFPGVLLGLSGGIDSALTLAVAVDALGAERVHAVLMPSRYTAEMSVVDAMLELKALAVTHSMLSIEPAYEALMTTLKSEFDGYPTDLTEENIQARIRGLLLMALSNKTGKMVLTTSNKSESAVGYATLYGDMCGGFGVLKDVLKTQVYALAHYRNTLSQVIPERVITRPPSAELRDNQTDQDSLPDYEILDAIIVAYMEKNLSPSEIIQHGFKPELVTKVIQMIKRNEYKRRQAAPGIKVSAVAFDKDWRYPITNGFK
ncbi:NAD+ synthase [Legionella rowbothamii]|uniref:NAD+ synthase n=1 Tax=Legionella rowbothamii TaxID=96229 RepID=UPI00105490AD|nr:NAD+ synthase [Legionella rowbothamii]